MNQVRAADAPSNGYWPGGTLAILARVAVPVLLLVLWQVAVSLEWVPRTLIASPVEVLVDLGRLVRNGTIWEHACASLARLIEGFVLGAAVGATAGAWIGLSRRVQSVLEPTITVLAPIPPTAWIPLLIILFGIGEASKVWLIAIGVFFVVAGNTASGIRNVDSRFVEVARICGKQGSEVLVHVLLPAAMPAILNGLRLGLGLSWILLIAAELIAANKGLGWFIFDARNFARPDDMMAGMVCVGCLGALTDRGMLAIQHRALRWQASFSGD